MVAREKHGPPTTLANMRRNGVRTVIASCEACGHKADVNVDALPETITSPRQADDCDALTAEVRRWIRDRLPLQEQLGEGRQTRKGQTSELDERLTPKPSSSRVSSQWKSRVKSRRKSTVSLPPTDRPSAHLSPKCVNCRCG